MRFFNPLQLLLALPVAGAIIVLYILKLKRKDVVVSSTLLWSQVIRDVQANAPFQKLRKNMLLYLQLLAALLLVLLLARPYFSGTGLGGRSVVIVVDNSASMASLDIPGGRLDAAKREASKIISDMRAEDQMMVISASAHPEAVTGFSSDKSELLQAVQGLKVHETTTNMRDALALAAALVSSRTAAQIDVISDGGFAPVNSVDFARTTHVLYHPVGKSAHNVGIVAVDYRRSLTGEKTVEVFVTVKNYDDKQRTFNIELKQDKSTVDAREVTLKPGQEDADVFDLPEPTEPVSLTVNIDAKDDLASDNRAALVIEPRKPVKALLVTAENVFLENSLRVDPMIDLSVGKPGTDPKGFDVVVYDQSAPTHLPEGNYFFVNCSSDQSPAIPVGETENVGVVDPNKTHPVLRYVDFGTTRWTRLRYAKAQPFARELASAENGAGIIAGEKAKYRSLWVGFDLDLAHGGFPLTVAYPIFVSNSLRWLAHAEDNGMGQVRTGMPVTLEAPPTAGQITVVKPDGSSRSLTANEKGTVVFDDTDQIGIYRATGSGGFARTFAANLADYDESNTQPKANQNMGSGGPAGEAGKKVTIVHELWPWLAGIALVLLCFEWYAFNRRAFAH